MNKALLVGSRPNWQEKLDVLLAERGIVVHWVWSEPGDSNVGIPKGCDVVLITTDRNSHSLSGAAARDARATDTKLVHINHRRSSTAELLTRAGFPPLQPVPVPVTTPTPEAPRMATTTTGNAPSSTPPTAPPSRNIVHGPRYFALHAADKVKCETVILPVLAVNPWLRSEEVCALVGLKSIDDVLAAARQTLSVVSVKGSAKIEEASKYEAVCRALGVVPVKERVAPSRMPDKPKQPPPLATPAATPAATPPASLAAPVAPVTHTGTVSGRVQTAAPNPPGNGPRASSSYPQVAAALALLKDAMYAESVSRIVADIDIDAGTQSAKVTPRVVAVDVAF